MCSSFHCFFPPNLLTRGLLWSDSWSKPLSLTNKPFLDMLKLCPSKRPDREFTPYPKCRMVHFKYTHSIVAFSCTYLLSWWDCRLSHFVILCFRGLMMRPLMRRNPTKVPLSQVISLVSIFEMPLGHASAALISLNEKTSKSPKLI